MSIGATLAAARRRAGLTVGEVSDRTRVRDIIIEAIEQDDYAPCGGDFYARGHIRAIAGTVGADPEPLLEEFDERWRSSPDLTAAEVSEPGLPLRRRERHRVRWLGVLAVLVLAVLGFAVYKLVSGVSPAHPVAAVSSQGPAQGGTPAAASASAPSVQAGTARPSNAQGSPTATSSAQAAAPPPATIPSGPLLRSATTRPRPGTATGTRPRTSGICSRAPDCCWTWAGRSPSPRSGCPSDTSLAPTLNCA